MKNILFEYYVAFAIVLFIAPLGRFEAIAGVPDKYWSPEYSDAYTKDSLTTVMEPALKLFVSPNGSDEADGSRNRPFGTLEAARDAIRELKKKGALPKGGVNVVLDGGRYHITRTFDIDSRDSGTMDAPVVCRGAEGEEVILAGGVPVDSSKFAIVSNPVLLGRLNQKARGKVMSMGPAGSGLGKYFPGSGDYGLISMDGHMLQLARWPIPKRRWLPGETFKSDIWLVNDLHEVFEDCRLNLAIANQRGKRVFEQTKEVKSIAGDSSVRFADFEWVVGGTQGENFRVEAVLVDTVGRTVSANHYVLLIADQQQARRECRELAEKLQATKKPFPTGDYYRFFPERFEQDQEE